MGAVAKFLRLGANLTKIALTRPARLTHVMGAALAASEEVRESAYDVLRLPEINVRDLLPESEGPIEARLVFFPKLMAPPTLIESVCLVLLLKKAKASQVFELGTHGGIFITQLALNIADGTTLSTSPPYDHVTVFDSHRGNRAVEEARGSIRFLKEEAAFDETPYLGKMDFVFVDGGHDFESVRTDSERGWRMLRSGGIMVWHDFSILTRDVVRYLLSSSYRPVHVGSTRLAFAVKA